MYRTDFQKNGFVCAPVFAASYVERGLLDIKTCLDRLTQDLQLSANQQDLCVGDRLEHIRQADANKAYMLHQAICKTAHEGPNLQFLGNNPALWEIASQACGYRLDSAIMRVRASLRGSEDALHPWHSDVARPDKTACGRVQLAAWIPLQTVGPETGSLEIASGKREGPHKRGDIPDGPFVRPVCPAGSALLIDRFTPHRSLPVRGVSARFALVVWFSKAD